MNMGSFRETKLNIVKGSSRGAKPLLPNPLSLLCRRGGLRG
jgi:hypothetical protein